jgi:hypothetical protein
MNEQESYNIVPIGWVTGSTSTLRLEIKPEFSPALKVYLSLVIAKCFGGCTSLQRIISVRLPRSNLLMMRH